MSDLISRQAAIDEFKCCELTPDGGIDASYAVEFLEQLPSAEPQERKTGRWIHDGFDHPYGIDWCHCSKCGNRESVDSVYTQVDIYPYCAKCGARMVVEHDTDR